MDKKKLGHKIKLARLEAELTQTELAFKIKAKQKSISGYETGTVEPSVSTLDRIAKAVQKPIGEFFEG